MSLNSCCDIQITDLRQNNRKAWIYPTYQQLWLVLVQSNGVGELFSWLTDPVRVCAYMTTGYTSSTSNKIMHHVTDLKVS